MEYPRCSGMTRYLLLLLNNASVPTAWMTAPSVNTLCAWLPRRWTSPLVPVLVAALQDVERVPQRTGRYYLGCWEGQQAFLLCESLGEEIE